MERLSWDASQPLGTRARARDGRPPAPADAGDGRPSGGYFYGGQWEHLHYRPQDEYCEWRVTRDPDGGIRRVTFTSEPPEYWQAMHGDTLPSTNGDPAYPTTGDPKLLLELYQEFVSPQVRYEDLVCAVDLIDYSYPEDPYVVYPKGTYNPYNRWNTTDGIMHLTQPSNSLSAEILLGADATVLRTAGRDGRIISDPDALICCAHYGGLNRCSDPTIGASVNELAALGFAITLRNPVGLYMDDLDVTGWAGPNGEPVDPAWFRIVRGRPGLIERAVFEVPERAGFRVSDVTIGGVPITVGGQLSEHMTMKLVGLASAPGKFANKPAGCAAGCCADAANPAFLPTVGSMVRARQAGCRPLTTCPRKRRPRRPTRRSSGGPRSVGTGPAIQCPGVDDSVPVAPA